MANLRNSASTTVLDAPAESELELDATDRMYVVEEGDTLSSIAKKFYGQASARWRILQANPRLIRDPYFVAPGWRLRIPR